MFIEDLTLHTGIAVTGAQPLIKLSIITQILFFGTATYKYLKRTYRSTAAHE